MRPFQKSTVRVGESFSFVFYYDKRYNSPYLNYYSSVFTSDAFHEDEVKGKVTAVFTAKSKGGSNNERRISGTHYHYSYNYEEHYDNWCNKYYTILDTNEEPLAPKPVTLSAPREVMVFEGKKTDIEVKVTTEATDNSCVPTRHTTLLPSQR